MKGYFLFPLVVFAFFLSIVGCENDNNTTFNVELAQLQSLHKEIEDFAATSTCGDNFECKYIAFGSKPCGGPWSYLIYSTSIDFVALETMVEDYNDKEATFNQKWGVVSDCAFVVPPIGIDCENNTCVPVYQN